MLSFDSLPAIRTDVSDEEYHKDRQFYTSGAIRLFDKNPGHFLRWLRGFSDTGETSAMRIGKLLDKALLVDRKLPLLESPPPEVLTTNGQRRGKAYEEWLARAESSGITPVSNDELNMLNHCYDSASRLIDRENVVSTQTSVFWRQNRFVSCKCRYDAMLVDGFFDLKTTVEDVRDFSRACYKYDYLTQMAWYATGYKEISGAWPKDIRFLVVSKSYPYDSCWYYMPDGFDEWAVERVGRLIEKLTSFRVFAHDTWFDAKHKININLSHYKKERTDELEIN